MNEQPECNISVLCDELLVLLTDIMSINYSWEQLMEKVACVVEIADHIDKHLLYDDTVTLVQAAYVLDVVAPRMNEAMTFVRGALATVPSFQWN